MAPKIAKRYNEAEKFERVAPLPLRRQTAPARPFPVKALGKILADAANAIVDKVQCPAAIACQAVLGAAALATQAHTDVVHPALNEPRPISLFLVTVASTGERKSAADRPALAPFRLREAELHEEHSRAQRAYLDAKDAYDKARETALRESKGNADETAKRLAALPVPPAPPLTPLLIVPEPTLEGLHKLMAHGEPSMGLFSDEGGTFIGGHGMTDEARLRTGAGLSDMWDGKTIKRVRGGDGVTILAGRRLSLHLMVQPGIAEALLADPILLQQGLTSRLLVAAPESIVGTRMQKQLKATTEPALKRYTERLLQLLRQKQRRTGPNNPELRPRQIPLSAEARRIWAEYADECERALGEGQSFEPVRGFANKLPEQAIRIAAVLELVENVEAPHVGAPTMQRAITITRYYAGEALRLFENGSSSIELQRAEKVLKWLHERWQRPVVALAHIYQLGPNSIRDASRAREAVTVLEQHHWLSPIAGGTKIEGKRHKEAWEVVFKG